MQGNSLLNQFDLMHILKQNRVNIQIVLYDGTLSPTYHLLYKEQSMEARQCLLIVQHI